MTSLTVTSVSKNQIYIDLNLEVNGFICPLELTGDNTGVYWLSIYGEYVNGFPPFMPQDYHDRTVIKWICERTFELSEIAKHIKRNQKSKII